MSTPRAAKRYAKSLFSLSDERGAIEHMENDVRQLQDAIAGSHELELLLKSPVIKADTKEKILVRIFDKNISDLSLEFVKILVRKGSRSDVAGHHSGSIEVGAKHEECTFGRGQDGRSHG